MVAVLLLCGYQRVLLGRLCELHQRVYREFRHAVQAHTEGQGRVAVVVTALVLCALVVAVVRLAPQVWLPKVAVLRVPLLAVVAAVPPVRALVMRGRAERVP